MTVFLWTVVVMGLAAPMLFVQKGTAWNTIQFVYYSLFITGIMSGVAVVKLKKLLANPLIYIIVVVVTLPTTWSTLYYHYLPSRPPAKISPYEVEALTFLHDQSLGTVLTLPFDRQMADAAIDYPPRPLYLYESTAYVSAYADKPVFLEDEVNLDITGYDWHARRQEIVDFFDESSTAVGKQFLTINAIKYVYLVGEKKPKIAFGELGLQKIFENTVVNIYIRN